ncbi:hypothetical protein CSAL01_12861 [Colletotrichum salicis]|uniref:Uncharacterized protein n=1 Tax=Colletotrichum salicis TaxID=1209931 RepID=A0A135TMR3_9PEZI|nr:hypothetical protein CSAL01_12861 [Colletotrichum salicis]
MPQRSAAADVRARLTSHSTSAMYLDLLLYGDTVVAPAPHPHAAGTHARRPPSVAATKFFTAHPRGRHGHAPKPRRTSRAAPCNSRAKKWEEASKLRWHMCGNAANPQTVHNSALLPTQTVTIPFRNSQVAAAPRGTFAAQSANLSTATIIPPRVRRLALPNLPANLSKMDQVPGCNLTATIPAGPLALGCFYPALPDEAPARHNLISRRATFARPLNKGHRSKTAVLPLSFSQSLEATGLSSRLSRFLKSLYAAVTVQVIVRNTYTQRTLRSAPPHVCNPTSSRLIPVIGHPDHPEKIVIRVHRHATTS